MFGTLDAAPRPFTVTDRTLSAQMGAYWVSFVRDGKPAAPQAAAWPTLATGRITRFGDAGGAPVPALPPAKAQAYRAFAQNGGKLAMFEHE